ncbi:MAG: hypothetical protein V4543_07580 [Bacteroidota bacterium]
MKNELTPKQSATAARLYNLYYDELLTVAMAVVKSKEPDFAKRRDLADRIVIDIIIYMAKNDYLDTVVANYERWYVGKSVKREAIRQISKQSPLKFIGDISTQSRFAGIKSASNPDYNAEQRTRELEAMLLLIIGRFTPTQKLIYELRVEDGLKFKEIGVRLNKSEATCRVVFNRLETKIKAELGEAGY